MVELVGDLIRVIRVGIAGDGVEAGERAMYVGPQLREPDGVTLSGAGSRRHLGDRTASLGIVNATAISVLVVDDDTALRTLSRILLQLEGFDVREAASLREVDAALSERRPDVVLLDVHLGSERTEELFTRLRSEGIPVAAVTGTADLKDVRSRADETLVKPFEPEQLIAMTKRLARVDAA